MTSGDDHHRTVLVYERGAVVRRLAAGATPQHVTFADSDAFVSSGDDGVVRVFSAAQTDGFYEQPRCRSARSTSRRPAASC